MDAKVVHRDNVSMSHARCNAPLVQEPRLGALSELAASEGTLSTFAATRRESTASLASKTERLLPRPPTHELVFAALAAAAVLGRTGGLPRTPDSKLVFRSRRRRLE
jgi:hypothetical protein